MTDAFDPEAFGRAFQAFLQHVHELVPDQDDSVRALATAHLGVEPGGPDVPAAAVPARAADLSGLPPTFISVGALDLFLEEDMEFVRRLTRAGVAAELHVVPGAYHGFGMAQDAPQVAQLSELRNSALARALRVVR